MRHSRRTVKSPRTLRQMIALADFPKSSVSRHINSANFPVNPECFGVRGAKLIRFGHRVKENEILAEFDRRGLRSATIEGLLAFCVRHRPEKDGTYMVAALGSPLVFSGGERYVPCLLVEDGRPYLCLHWAAHGRIWFERTEYLGVPKSRPAK